MVAHVCASADAQGGGQLVSLLYGHSPDCPIRILFLETTVSLLSKLK